MINQQWNKASSQTISPIRWHGWLLLSLFILTSLYDLILTLVNLGWLGYEFEGNPLVRGAWTGIILKTCIIIIACSLLNQTKYRTQGYKHIVYTFFLVGIVSQAYAGSTHLPFLQLKQTTVNTYVANDLIQLVQEDGSIIQYRIYQNLFKSLAYLKLIWWLSIYPMAISLLSYYFANKQSEVKI